MDCLAKFDVLGGGGGFLLCFRMNRCILTVGFLLRLSNRKQKRKEMKRGKDGDGIGGKHCNKLSNMSAN